METNITKGRNIVIGAMSIVIGISLLSIAANLISGVNQNYLVQLVRFGLTCLLCYFVYDGQKWAKWMCIVLMAVTIFVGLLGTIVILADVAVGLMSFLYSAAYLTVILLLIVPKSVKDYFNSKQIPMQIDRSL